MEQVLALCSDSALFAGVRQDALPGLLACLHAEAHTYARGETIAAKGERLDRMGVVLRGRVSTVYEDAFGGRSILDTVEAGQLFGDVFGCSCSPHSLVAVIAQTDALVLRLDTARVLAPCEQGCTAHTCLPRNMVGILAEKYIAQNRKMIHLCGRTTRRKLLSYLSECMDRAGGNPFPVPFTQQELADYLFLDRSGLSTELNKLKKEGLLRSENGQFSLQVSSCVGYDCDA